MSLQREILQPVTTAGLLYEKNPKKHQPLSKNPIFCKSCNAYTEFYNKEIFWKEHYLKLHNPMKNEKSKAKNNPASHFKKTNEDYQKGIFPQNWFEKRKAGIKRHDDAISEELKSFEKQGFRVIPIGRFNDKKPDFIAFKDNMVFAIEVELDNPDYMKYKEVNYYNDVIWILKDQASSREKSRIASIDSADSHA